MDHSMDLMNSNNHQNGDFMNAPFPPATDFESISSEDITSEASHTSCHAGCSASDSPVTALEGTWRVAHTLKNHDNVKLESPSTPVLTFWYIRFSLYLTQAWSDLARVSHDR
jgi:hypothetical protein